MTSFEDSIKLILKHEGGYQVNQNDTGNYNSLGKLVGTKLGISAKTLESYLGYPPTAQQVKDLTLEDAKNIYKINYWDKYKLSDITDQYTATHIFDLFVNHGPSSAARIIQKAINSLNFHVDIDGKWGTATRTQVNNAISKARRSQLNNYISIYREEYYNDLVKKNPKLGVFLKGWVQRAKSFFFRAR